MKLGYARIFVKDLEAAVAFYRDTLGLELAWHDRSTGLTAGPAQHAGFKTGDCTLLLEPNDGEDQKLFTALSFTVNDIEAEHKRLAAQGVEFTPALEPLSAEALAKAEPTKMEWGGTLAYFKDPDGHVLGMVARAS